MELGIGTAAISRNIGLLSDTGYKARPGAPIAGLGLVEAWYGEIDRRVKTIRLTPKGHALIERASSLAAG